MIKNFPLSFQRRILITIQEDLLEIISESCGSLSLVLQSSLETCPLSSLPERTNDTFCPRFPGRIPWPFSCTVSELVKFYSACYMLYSIEYWLSIQGEITEFFYRVQGMPCPWYSCVCQKTSQPREGSCLSVSAPREKEGWGCHAALNFSSDAEVFVSGELQGQLFIFTCYHVSISSPMV